MHAMVLAARGAKLTPLERPDPVPGLGQVRIKVSACGVCRTDLHVVDGELPDIPYPIIPGHEVVGRVEALGAGVTGLPIGMRVGVPWLGFTCGECFYCQADKENLTRKDGADFFKAIQTHTTMFPLDQANEALSCLREGRLVGAAVLRP